MRGRFEFFLSLFILEEVAGVFTRNFDWDGERKDLVLRGIENAANAIDPPRLPEMINGSHPDNRILECAAAANADWLVTGARRQLLPIGEHQGARIINAPRFLSELSGRR